MPNKYKYYLVKVFQDKPQEDLSQEIRENVRIPETNINKVVQVDNETGWKLEHPEEE